MPSLGVRSPCSFAKENIHGQTQPGELTSDDGRAVGRYKNKEGGGLICKVDGIMCPFVEIGLTHFPKFGGPWPTLPHRPRQDWIVKSGEVVPALY